MSSVANVRISSGTGSLFQVNPSTTSSTLINISTSTAASASINILNDGKGLGIFEGISSSGNYLFKSLISGPGISLTPTDKDITIIYEMDNY